MEKQIQVENYCYHINVPEKCPICHKYGDTQIVHNFRNFKNSRVEVVFKCVFPECRSYFIGYYPPRERMPNNIYFYLAPQKCEMVIFKESLPQISPRFIEIYMQAEEARNLGLKDIAGPGFRKAFEFLIKDYAKSLVDPAQKELIEKKFSGDVVNEYIADKRIQAVAKRALWLGNDETHYLRKWEEHDLEDLIVLIKLATDWIDIDQLTKEYSQTMPEKTV